MAICAKLRRLEQRVSGVDSASPINVLFLIHTGLEKYPVHAKVFDLTVCKMAIDSPAAESLEIDSLAAGS